MLPIDRCRELADEMERESVLLNERNRMEHLFLAAELRDLAQRRSMRLDQRAA